MAVRYLYNHTIGPLLQWPYQNRYNAAATAVGLITAFSTKYFLQSPYHVALLTGLAVSLTLAYRHVSHQKERLEDSNATQTKELQRELQGARAELTARKDRNILEQKAQEIKVGLHLDEQDFQAQWMRRNTDGETFFVLRHNKKVLLSTFNISPEAFENIWQIHPDSHDERSKLFMDILPIGYHEFFQAQA